MPHSRPIDRHLVLPVSSGGLRVRPATQSDAHVLTERLVAERARTPETLGRGMRALRDMVLAAGAMVVHARSAKDGVLAVEDADGAFLACVEGHVTSAPAADPVATLRWSAVPGAGGDDAALAGARIVTAALFASGVARVSIAYDDEESLLAAQAQAMGFEPDDGADGTSWSVSADRFVDSDEDPPHP